VIVGVVGGEIRESGESGESGKINCDLDVTESSIKLGKLRDIWYKGVDILGGESGSLSRG
jgi:hypothetical protein